MNAYILNKSTGSRSYGFPTFKLAELHADFFSRHALEGVVFVVVVVDETNGSTDSSTSYQVPGIQQETVWEVFKEQRRIDREIYFASVFTYQYVFSFLLL